MMTDKRSNENERWNQKRVSYVFSALVPTGETGTSPTTQSDEIHANNNATTEAPTTMHRRGLSDPISTTVKASTNTLLLGNILADPTLAAQFKSWIISARSGEERQLYMLDALRKLKQLSSLGGLTDPRMAALDLYRKYLTNGAENEINMEASLRFEVLERIDQGFPVEYVSFVCPIGYKHFYPQRYFK